LRGLEEELAKPTIGHLSRRERQIMDVLYQRSRATAAEVLEALPDPPSYSAVRALLRILEEKGHIRHEVDGPRYVYAPRVDRNRARQSALRHLVQTFFDGSVAQAAAALLDQGGRRFSDEELERLAAQIERARTEEPS
jgi:BlaI family transcriptional regulator, penicillinase repressor